MRSLFLSLAVLGGAMLLVVPALSADARKQPRTDLPKGVFIDLCLVSAIEQIEVPAREAGHLETLLFREGAIIKEGAEIGQVDIEKATLEKLQAEIEYEAAQMQADSDINVRFAQASYDVAQQHYLRALEANENVKNSVATSEVAERLLAAKKAKLQIEQAELELKVARATAKAKKGLVQIAEANIRRRTITAPAGGMIVEIKKRKGEWLNPGDPLVRVIPMNRLRVEGFLDADKHGSELTGQSVMVDARLPGGKHEKFTGKVVYVSPEIEPVTNQIRVWAEVENPNLHLRPGARVSMVIDEPAQTAAAK